jgi:peptidoglycan/LPS O-acetylase OafA/YrhL
MSKHLLHVFAVTPPADQRRLVGLDLVRTAAIVLVVFGHGAPLLPQSPWAKLLLWNGGYFGVELFFVLSGCLIGGMLLRTFAAAPPTAAAIRQFWIRRWFRTLPNYYLFLLLAIVLGPLWLGRAAPDLRYLGFVQNLAWPCPAAMPESWSLAVEEWFYLLIPLLLLPAARCGSRLGLLGSIVGSIIAVTVLRCMAVGAGGIAWDGGVRKVVLYRLDAIGYGVLIAWLEYYHGARVDRAARPLAWVGGACIAVAALKLSGSVLTNLNAAFNMHYLLPLTSIGFACMLPWCRRLRLSWGPLVRPVTHISIISYAMYLCHYAWVLPATMLLTSRADLDWRLSYGIYLLATVLLSTLVYCLYERPMTNLRERFAAAPTRQTERSDPGHPGRSATT